MCAFEELLGRYFVSGRRKLPALARVRSVRVKFISIIVIM